MNLLRDNFYDLMSGGNHEMPGRLQVDIFVVIMISNELKEDDGAGILMNPVGSHQKKREKDALFTSLLLLLL